MRREKRKSRILIVMILLVSIVAGSFVYLYGKQSSDHTVTVFLVRHGQTVSNTQGILVGGGGDAPLTTEGKAGVLATGRALQNVRFSRAYSSPLGRTVTTRDLILSENRYSNQTKRLEDKRLKDISWGRAEGMSVENATSSFGDLSPDHVFGIISDKNFFSPIGAESKYHFYHRFNSAMDEIGGDERNRGKSVLVVAHSSAGYWLSEVFHKEDYTTISNAGVTILQYRDGKWKMVDFNDLDKNQIETVCQSLSSSQY